MNIKYIVSSRFGLNRFLTSNASKNLISVFDTSIASENVGDQIINDSASKIVQNVFKNNQLVRFPTHIGMSSKAIYLHNKCKKSILCGTNILNSNMLLNRQWDIGLLQAFRMRKIILLGCGWGNYQKKPNLYTRILLRMLLDKNALHSVRDNYSKKMLESIGIDNVISTSCPTMWGLDEEHCSSISEDKSEVVITTLTDYRQDKNKDNYLLKELKRNYQKVYFWVQGSADEQYFSSLEESNDIIVIPPSLAAFDKVLENENCDFIGTRLHAGIRAIQKKRRTIIIGVDNRALEKKKDFNLNVIERKNIEAELAVTINESMPTRIIIDFTQKNKWMDQFK